MLALLILTLGWTVPADALTLSPDEFRSWFDAAEKNRLAIPADVSANAREFRYVFVGGFRGESMRGYFSENIQELPSRRVPKTAIHVLSPSSHKTVEENS